MDYEKGAPRNLVQFSEYNDLAFTDTGVTIDDNSRPNKNVVWSSDKIEKRLAEIAGGKYIPYNSSQIPSINLPVPQIPQIFADRNEYYPNGYKIYVKRGRLRLPRIFRPSWWISNILPNRQHYCDKCCNYRNHFFSTVWGDDPKLDNYKCNCTSRCNNRVPAIGPPPAAVPAAR